MTYTDTILVERSGQVYSVYTGVHFIVFWARYISQDVSADASPVCGKAAVLRDTIKRTICISYSGRPVFNYWPRDRLSGAVSWLS